MSGEHNETVTVMPSGYTGETLQLECTACGWIQDIDGNRPTIGHLTRLAEQHECHEHKARIIGNPHGTCIDVRTGRSDSPTWVCGDQCPRP